MVVGKYDDEVLFPEKLITINKKLGFENQLYTILHECGHLLINNNKNYIKNHPYSYKPANKKLYGTIKYEVDLVSEEIEAWNRGKCLAKKLKIYIDEKKYFNHMSRYVFTYIKFNREK